MSTTSLKNKTILVVDDHSFLRKIITDILRNIGINKILTARDGSDAMAQIKNQKPDIVITDLMMEPVDGLALTRWIRRAEDSPDQALPVIMLTGNSDQDVMIDARDAGISEIIIKPVVPKAVISRLLSVTRNKRGFVRTFDYVGPDRRRRTDSQYRGVGRRLVDVQNEEHAEDAVQKEYARCAGKILPRINDMTHNLKTIDLNSRAQVLDFYHKAEALWNFCQEEAPKLLAIATESLLRYIQAFGANGMLNKNTIGRHLVAITRLVKAHSLPETERKNTVDKLLKEVSAQLSVKKST